MEYGQPFYMHYVATNQHFTGHSDGAPGMGNQISEREYYFLTCQQIQK